MNAQLAHPATRLLPPGSRWGFGARTVLPYLVHSLEVRPAAAEIVIEDSVPISNPVFAVMDITVTAVRKPAPAT